MATQQIEAVKIVLAELDVAHIPMLTVWNKVGTLLFYHKHSHFQQKERLLRREDNLQFVLQQSQN